MEAHLVRHAFTAAPGIEPLACGAVVRTSEINVIFTTPEATMAALRVAATLGHACNAPVRLIAAQVRTPRVANMPPPCSPVESDAFRARVAEEIDARVEIFVCVCRRMADVARRLLRRHSLVVIGGRPSWWPTREERVRRTLEAHGHLVVFVNEGDHAA